MITHVQIIQVIFNSTLYCLSHLYICVLFTYEHMAFILLYYDSDLIRFQTPQDLCVCFEDCVKKKKKLK